MFIEVLVYGPERFRKRNHHPLVCPRQRFAFSRLTEKEEFLISSNEVAQSSNPHTHDFIVKHSDYHHHISLYCKLNN